ncbi:MAG: hypothetical protein ABI862_00120 [Ilumatobacteraceae bacterium]
MTWAPLNLIATEPEAMIDALVQEATVRQAFDDLLRDGLVTISDSVRLTDHGRATRQEISVGLDELTKRLYAGLAHDDLLVARRVLETLTSRARAELANAS